MSKLTAAGLRDILRAAGGEAENRAGTEILDVPFEDLGYDSLALLETAARIQREYGVRLDDEWVAEVATPRDLLRLANAAIAATR
jgi:act minimal PKS acyl carrier protein